MKNLTSINNKVVFLMGPTASGKTALAIELQKELPIKIISVDSASIYRDMNIGTSKFNNKLLRFPCYLIDICDPSEVYSVFNFQYDAIHGINKIMQSGYIPLLVGGSMLYFKVLLEGLSPLPKSNPEVRSYIRHQAEVIGWKGIHQKLKEVDPISASNIHENDTQRLSRAWEVFLILGQTLTEIKKKSKNSLPYQIYQFAICPSSRIKLNQKINQRFYKMLDQGFEKEVRKLFCRSDLHKNMPSMRCIGYRQMWSYFAKEINYDEMILCGIRATQQLAKKQMTWLRNWENIYWISEDDTDRSIESIKKILNI